MQSEKRSVSESVCAKENEKREKKCENGCIKIAKERERKCVWNKYRERDSVFGWLNFKGHQEGEI